MRPHEGNPAPCRVVSPSRMRIATLPLLALVALVSLGGQDAEIGETPTFSLDVKVVNVLATVKDRNGRLLSDLSKDDFVLSEDGTKQEIRYFAHQTDLPLTIGLLIDTSGSQGRLIPEERRAGALFLQSVLRPRTDLAFLMSFDRNVELLQDFTDSLPLLERGLGGLEVEVPTGGFHPNPTGDRKQTSTALHDALYLAADEMFRNQVGRKAVVIISDGVDYGSKVKLKTAIEAAQRADIVVYTIEYFDRRFQGYIGLRGLGGGSGSGTLKRMSEQTGGSFFRLSGRNRLADVFRQIEEEMRSQYSIGYSPTRGLEAPGFRRITLKSPRKGVKIQARDGYYADAI